MKKQPATLLSDGFLDHTYAQFSKPPPAALKKNITSKELRSPDSLVIGMATFYAMKVWHNQKPRVHNDEPHVLAALWQDGNLYPAK